MKLKNIYLISLALIAGAFAGCTDDTENFDNQLFVTSKTPTAFYVKTTVQDVQNATGEFSLSIPKPSMQDVTFTIKADAGLVSVYEDTYYVSGVEALPEGHYSFSTTEGKIAAGALKSNRLPSPLRTSVVWTLPRPMYCRLRLLMPVLVYWVRQIPIIMYSKALHSLIR